MLTKENVKTIIKEICLNNNYTYFIDNYSFEIRIKFLENIEYYNEIINELNLTDEEIIIFSRNIFSSVEAKELYNNLSKKFMTTYDESGSIGKRYRREDIIGTPFCITVDEDTINNDTVTIRDRDTMKQEKINISDIEKYIEDRIKF